MNDLKKTMIAASCLVLSMLPVEAQTAQTKPAKVNATAVAPTRRPRAADTRPPSVAARRTQPATRVIVVSLEDRRLALVEDGAVRKVYHVAVGKDTTPSPTGTFTIVERVENPTYYHEGQVIPAGPEIRWARAGWGSTRKATAFMERTPRAPSARPRRTDAFACGKRIWRSCLRRCRVATRWRLSANETTRPRRFLVERLRCRVRRLLHRRWWQTQRQNRVRHRLRRLQ